mmetsp:Transcript_2755/g.5927  ORF Transcript_2755/g.5927 Transcript_2755/m.5927 type:complete len:385 (-) Transcript_2755:46-1200(-)
MAMAVLALQLPTIAMITAVSRPTLLAISASPWLPTVQRLPSFQQGCQQHIGGSSSVRMPQPRRVRCIGSRHCPYTSGSRYARLRRRLSAQDDITNELPDLSSDSAQLIAKATVTVLTRKGKTWKRLGPLVEMACCGCSSDNDTIATRTIADIGTDHGVLSIALAATSRYKRVIGVDVSEMALDRGARSFHRKVLDVLARDKPEGNLDSSNTDEFILPVEFRVGDGLSVLEKGEAEIVAIAGMGAHSMINILQDDKLRRIGTSRLLVQPTNSRPRNLISLYDNLQRNGWALREEHIKFISRRWYISAAFDRDPAAVETESYNTHVGDSLEMPGDKLRILTVDNPMYKEYMRYIDHHRHWLERDMTIKGALEEQDMRWFDVYGDPQ